MLNFHKNHKNLVFTSIAIFLGLSILVAVVPAYELHNVQALPSMEPFTPEELNGLKIYTSENCMSCHTQQIRNIEMDMVWGERPSIPSDYYYSKKRLDVWRQSPSLLGSERTGPDLTNVAKRQPGIDWHLLHLFNPRIVVEESVMPGYPWLFIEKNENEIKEGEVVVAVPKEFMKNPNKKVVATKKVMDLVAYLLTLKQADLMGPSPIEFIPAKVKKVASADGEMEKLDGAILYTNNCAACHQANGKGLEGAFPALAGSDIVNDKDPELLIRIILQGYDSRPEYSVMAPFADLLTDEEIAAIATHERSSWGNDASEVTAEDVAEIRAYVESLNL